MKILVITIGGSCAPIVTSIKENAPLDKIYFICSDDTEQNKGSYTIINGNCNVCGKDQKNPDEPNILIQTGIGKEKEGSLFHIRKIKYFDNLNECYIECFNLLNDLKKEYPLAEIIADYTGGTKSMSAGLGAASMAISDITVCLVKGSRKDLIKVQDGTQRIRLTGINIAFLNKQIDTAKSLMKRFDYDGAIKIFEETAKHPNIPHEMDDELQKSLVLSKAFLAWDFFDHIEAWRLLNPFRKYFVKNLLFLEAVISSRQIFDEKYGKSSTGEIKIGPKGCGYELVEDLVLNAERRAEQGRFDDAVARFYRALEMLVQLRLKSKYSILTEDVKNDRIPEISRPKYEKERDPKDGKIRIGLRQSYELLMAVNKEDTLSKIYLDKQNQLLDILKVRNESLYAHGTSPIPKEDYERFKNIFIVNILDNFLSYENKHIPRCQFG